MYAKLFASLYQGTLRGNSHGILVFTNMLAHADLGGHVDMHPRAIADEVGLTLEQVQAAIDELEAPDMESRSPDENGRRIIRLDEHRAWGWLVVNHAKYRAIRSEEDRREQNRLAQLRWRQKQADSKQSKPASAERKQDKPPSAHTDTDTEEDTRKTENIERAPKSARKRAAAAPLVSLPDLISDGVSEEHARDWLTARKAKGMPLTPTAWEGTKREASKAGITIDAAIETAAVNGWAGFKADWMDRPGVRRANGSPRKSDALMAGNIAAAQRFLERKGND